MRSGGEKREKWAVGDANTDVRTGIKLDVRTGIKLMCYLFIIGGGGLRLRRALRWLGA